MGYGMGVMETNFKLWKELHDKALEAIKGLAGHETIKYDDYPAHFSWVDTKEFLKARHIEDALEAWRWKPEFNSEGDIIDINFTGEKYGDDEILFKAIAPFVEYGSYIQMQGEDGAVWRWVFKDGQVREVKAKMVFEE